MNFSELQDQFCRLRNPWHRRQAAGRVSRCSLVQAQNTRDDLCFCRKRRRKRCKPARSWCRAWRRSRKWWSSWWPGNLICLSNHKERPHLELVVVMKLPFFTQDYEETKHNFSAGDKLIWINFSKFSNQLIVTKLEQDQTLRYIEKVLAEESQETLRQEPVVGQVCICSWPSFFYQWCALFLLQQIQ